MSPTKIATLTPEQEALIPVILEKWTRVFLSTQPLNRDRTQAAVRCAYRALGKKEPTIRFFPSPIAAKQLLFEQQSPRQTAQQLGAPLLIPFSTQLGEQILNQLEPELSQQLQAQLFNQELVQLWQMRTIPLWQGSHEFSEQELTLVAQLREEWLAQQWEQQQREIRQQLLQFPGGEIFLQIGDSLWENIGEPLWQELENQPFVQWCESQLRQNPLWQFADVLGFAYYSFLLPGLDASALPGIDFSISVLNCQYNPQQWQALESLLTECGCIFPFEKTCIVCERPRSILLDNEHRLHGEGEPAIQFADGYSFYYYRGVSLPEKYGRLHPNQWQSRWLLEEPNAELRRVLIQGIGYGRICQELQVTELDYWREYTLLRIDNEVDVEAIYLLKMICPSTGHIHATRVPPTVISAREAISWVNWDTDPEEFSVET